jgi:hypothetical protein
METDRGKWGMEIWWKCEANCDSEIFHEEKFGALHEFIGKELLNE